MSKQFKSQKVEFLFFIGEIESMKTLKSTFILFLFLQISACASANRVSEGATASAGTTLCIQAPCTTRGETFLEALAAGFGAGLGWGAATAITRHW